MKLPHGEALFDRLLPRMRQELSLLPDKPDESPEVTLASLWALAQGESAAVSELAGIAWRPLDAASERRLMDLVERRLAGEPLAHLTGRQDFMGLVLKSSPGALVPRKETEQLGFAASARLKALGIEGPLLIDVCTGSGNVALGIATQVPGARVFGADLSEDAVLLARENASFVGRPDVEFRCGDLLAPFDEAVFHGAADLITCNPPYISSSRVDQLPDETGRHEPRLAFDGGPFGVRIVRRLLNEAPRFVKPGGWVVFEIGAGQGAGVAKMAQSDPRYDDVHTHSNANGEIRVIEARRAATGGK
jgi:release factor glutamine methyltransferase